MEILNESDKLLLCNLNINVIQGGQNIVLSLENNERYKPQDRVYFEVC